MKNIIAYNIFEKFKMPSKEYIIDKIESEFPSIEDAISEVDYYIDSINDLQKNGGEVYRLVWLEKKSELNSKGLL